MGWSWGLIFHILYFLSSSLPGAVGHPQSKVKRKMWSVLGCRALEGTAPADWKSAIRQVGNLRYVTELTPQSLGDLATSILFLSSMLFGETLLA